MTRGTPDTPPNRFESFNLERDENWDPKEEPTVHTEFFKDHSQSIISWNDSPDIPFKASVNPYRGCEHGCAYCYARPTHEYLGYSAGLDFESRILVKLNAPELLHHELASTKWKPQPIALSGVTDPYQPVERQLRITRSCLQVLRDFRNPTGIVTKNLLIQRDLDLLQEMSRFNCIAVYLSITTLNSELRAIMEPRTSPTAARLDAIRQLSRQGVPVGVLVAPVIPGLNDHEVPDILQAAKEAGARFAGYVLLRLPLAVAPIFEGWLKSHFPLQTEKVLHQIRNCRGGGLNDSSFGSRMKGRGQLAENIRQLFRVHCRKQGIENQGPSLDIAHFRNPNERQLEFWRR